ncbi:MAG: hypothetical protein KKD39_04910 [Candidatus Altiarchaeota archaeon]|nr:hypothetical protein [Candidatus Altiarchaeota archaeon]
MKTVEKTSVNTTVTGMSEIDQLNLAEELTQLETQQKPQLEGALSGVSPHDIGSLSARKTEIMTQLSDVEADANTPTSIDTETKTRIQQPGVLGGMLGRIPLIGNALDKSGIIQTKPRRIVEHNIDVTEAAQMSENARIAMNQTQR